jgi:hypothetical protein
MRVETIDSPLGSIGVRRSADAHTPHARRLANEVDARFAADDNSWPCAFLSICHALGLDASAVRTRLARSRTEAKAKVVTPQIERTDAYRAAADGARRVAATG